MNSVLDTMGVRYSKVLRHISMKILVRIILFIQQRQITYIEAFGTGHCVRCFKCLISSNPHYKPVIPLIQSSGGKFRLLIYTWKSNA